jgi:hypothetical protein
MHSALHISTKVLPGNKIEISALGLPVGEAIEVFLIPSDTSSRSRGSTIDSRNGDSCINNNSNGWEPILTEHLTSDIQSDIEAMKALEVVEDYLTPEVGSLFEEMLNDALKGRIRLEATDIQDKMLIQHHAKKYVQQAIAALQSLIERSP